MSQVFKLLFTKLTLHADFTMATSVVAGLFDCCSVNQLLYKPRDVEANVKRLLQKSSLEINNTRTKHLQLTC